MSSPSMLVCSHSSSWSFSWSCCSKAVTGRLSVGQLVLGFHWSSSSTFVPPGDETGDEPQVRRSELSQDKDPLDPQTAEAQRASNETAGMGWRPTNRAGGMVEAARLCHPDSGRPAPVLSLAPPPTSSCLPSGHLPGKPYEENHQPRLATQRPHPLLLLQPTVLLILFALHS